jgi:hypothetical protein
MPLIVRLDSTTLEQHLNAWCPNCLLPSAYDCAYATELDGQACGVLRIKGCVECGP